MILVLGFGVILEVFLLLCRSRLVNPFLRDLPQFDGVVFAASDQLLELFVPSHLCNSRCMCLKHVHGTALLRIPKGDAAILISRYYFSAALTPQHYPLLWLSLSISNSLCQPFFSWISNVENSNVPIDVRGHKEVLRLTLFYDCLRPVIHQISTPGEASNANFLVRFHLGQQLWV